MNRHDWVVMYRRSLVGKGTPRYYFGLTFDEVAIKVLSRKYKFVREDTRGWHYISTKQIGYNCVIIKRGDISNGKSNRKAIITQY